MRVAFPVVVFSGCIPRLHTHRNDTDEVQTSWIAPDNTWSVATPPPGLNGEGYELGDVIPDFRLIDQFGADVSLWQFYGNVVLLDISTIWCGPCQALAEHTEETWRDYADEGFVYLTLIQEDANSAPPDAQDLMLWVDEFELTAPVLADGDKTGIPDVSDYPKLLVIGRDMKIRQEIDPPDDAHVRAAVEDALAKVGHRRAAEPARGCQSP